MFADDAVHGTKTEAGTLSDRLGGVERVEDLRSVFHAWSRITEFEDGRIILPASADENRATSDRSERFHRITDDVKANLQHLVRVSRDPRESGVKVLSDGDAGVIIE